MRVQTSEAMAKTLRNEIFSRAGTPEMFVGGVFIFFNSSLFIFQNKDLDFFLTGESNGPGPASLLTGRLGQTTTPFGLWVPEVVRGKNNLQGVYPFITANSGFHRYLESMTSCSKGTSSSVHRSLSSTHPCRHNQQHNSLNKLQETATETLQRCFWLFGDNVSHALYMVVR